MPSEEIVKGFITRDNCLQILQDSFCDKVKLVDFSILYFKKQMGYLGESFRLSITYHSEDFPEESKSIEFFVKTVPISNIKQNNLVSEMGVFKKEVLVYKNLINPLLKLSSRTFAPRLFLSDSEKYMVLENMFLKGYKTSKSNYLSFEQCVSMMKTLASFHGGSLIYEELQSKKTGKIYRLVDNFKQELAEGTFSFRNGHPRQKWCVSTTKSVIDLISLLMKHRSEKNQISKKVNPELFGKKFHNIMFTQMPEFLKPSKRFRNVCTHDDLWCNNLMFNDRGDSVLVDFQLTRYTPPAFDVLLFLVINLDRKLYNEKKDALLEIYYNALSEELELHQLPVEKIFPITEFHESLEYYFLPAVIEAAMYGTNVYIQGQLQRRILSDVEVFHEFMAINRSKYVVAEYKENEMYRERLNHVLIPLVEYLVNNCI